MPLKIRVKKSPASLLRFRKYDPPGISEDTTLLVSLIAKTREKLAN